MDNEVRLIDLRQFFRYLKSKIVILILAAVACGVLLAGYSYMKQNKEKGTTAVDLLDLTMQQNHNAYYIKNIKYSDAVPYTGVYNSAARLYIDFNYSDIENIENVNIAEMNSQYENDACQFIRDMDILNEIIEELNLRSYNDMKDITAEKLQWLCNRNFQGAHIMNIVISDVDPERAKAICDKLVEKFMKKAGELEFVDSIKVLTKASLPEDDGLYGAAIVVEKEKTVDKKAVLKLGIIGVVGGLLLIAILLFVVYIVRDVVRSGADMMTLGLDIVTGSDRVKADYERTARAIELYSDVQNILMVSVDRHAVAEGFVDDVKKELKKLGSSKKVSYAEDFTGSINALDLIKECDAVIYITKYNKTKLADITEARKVLERSGVRSLGGLII